jgi:DHA2 family multidrug resistance protein-like MFS transporter
VLLPEAFPGASVRRGARDLSLAAFVGIGIFVFTSLYLQWVVGLSPLRAGLWTSPMALALLAGSLLTPAIARVRPALVIAASLLLAAIGFALLGRLGGRVEPRPLRRR